MAFEELNHLINGQFSDYYCVVKDKKQEFYWVINLEDHPSSFLLDHTYQNLKKVKGKEGAESIVIKLPYAR